jgi:excisionase family DNA binding protein
MGTETKSIHQSLAKLRRAVETLPPGSSLTLPREALLELLTGTGAAAPPDDLLTPDEAAALLKTKRRWVYKHAADPGAVHLTRRKLRIPRAGVERFLKRKR